jgi:hypothetical protein
MNSIEHKSNRYIWLIIIPIILKITSFDWEKFILPFPAENIAPRNVNTYVRIYPPFGWNNFKYNNPISIEVVNTGDEMLYFTGDLNIQCFRISRRGWQLVEKYSIKDDEGVTILYPIGGDFASTSIAEVWPIINDHDNVLFLRVIVTGQLFIGGLPTDDYVGAYTDVILFP